MTALAIVVCILGALWVALGFVGIFLASVIRFEDRECRGCSERTDMYESEEEEV